MPIKFIRFTRHKLFIPIVTTILTIPAFVFLLQPNQYWNMHDDMQMVRQLTMEKCLHDGQIPCRWSPDLGYGYGYPLFNYYPPLPYIIGQLFRTVGFSFMDSVKATFALQFILSAYFMYLLGKNLGGKKAGLLASLFYTYAPYHAVNVFVRGAMNEAWAAVFFPLILLSGKLLIQTQQTKYLLLLSFAYTLLLLSHNPMALIFTPIFAFWCVYWLYHHYQSTTQPRMLIKPIFKLSISATISFGLSAFFLLPVLFETKLVQIESMFSNYYHYSVHFTSIKQLFFSNYWGNGASVWGQEDNMSFAVGYLHWFLPLLILFYSCKQLISNKRKYEYILPCLIVLLGFLSAFLTHQRSAPVWALITPIQKIQFPWRFLNITAFMMSLSISFLPIIIKRHFNSKVSGLLFTTIIFGLLGLNLKHHTPLEYGPLTDAQKFSGKAWENQITSGIYDYLPVTAAKAPNRPASILVDDTIPPVTYQVTGAKSGSNWKMGNISLPVEATVVLSQLYFPNFQVINNGLPISHQVEPEFGRITVDLPAGNNQLIIRYQNTPIRTIANAISLLTYVILAYYFINKWSKSRWQMSKNGQ